MANNAALDDQYTRQVLADPVIARLVQAWQTTANDRSQGGYRAHAAAGDIKQQIDARLAALGINPKDWALDFRNGRLVGVDHQNFFERHPVALTAAAVAAPFAAMTVPGLAAGGGVGSYGAPPAVGAGAGSSSWLTNLIKGGAAMTIPALARKMNGSAAGGNGGTSGAGPAGAAVDALIPEIVKRFQLQNARAEQSGPLYDAVLKMATGRLPIWTRG